MENQPRLNIGQSNKKRMRLWMIIGAVLLIAGLTAVAISLFGGHRIEGNEGVLALYDFSRTYEQGGEAATDGLYKTIGQRILNEAFEIGTDLEIEAQGISIMGLPMPRINGSLDIKYDKHDLGLKVKALGFDVIGVYLLGGDMVVDMGGSVQAQTIGTAPEGELPLEQRIALLLPNLPKGDAQQRVFEALAQSVPLDATHMEQASVFSQAQGAEVEAEAVVTQLDAQALSETAAALLAAMETDALLAVDVQAFYAPVAQYMGVDNAESALTQLAENAAEDTYLEWTVFRQDGVPLGYHAAIRYQGREFEWSLMAEFEGKTRFERVTARQGGGKTMTLAYNIDFEKSTLQGDIAAEGLTLEFEGTHNAQALTSNAYAITSALVVNGEVMGLLLSDATVDLRADIGFGDDLGTLAQTRGWRDIYEKEIKSGGIFVP